ncbi:MAG TPA: DUF4153 domain-containing protein [Candidatus Saccharimonadales bacterium]|nr:DUF4153 domain-containing protein [Candidatus Saccharimonadales bacterium]
MKLLTEKLGSKIPIISLIISIVVAWLVAPLAIGFPMVAFFIFFVSVSTLIYILRKNKTYFDKILYIIILLLSFFTLYRANGFLEFFDFLFIIFLGSILIHPMIQESNIIDLVGSPLRVIKDVISAKNIFTYKVNWSNHSVKASYIREYIPTVIITLVILVITVPLLASANPFFNTLLQQLLKICNLEGLLTYLFADPLYVYILRGIALLFLIFFIPRILSISTVEIKMREKKQFLSINYLIPKIAMSCLLIIFLITQIQLYFASAQTLQNMGYTNSRLTNEVFFQVTLVAFIVFILTYLDTSKKRWNKQLTYLLLIEAFFLVAIAFKSVFDYTTLWGFTQKRLWGYTAMIWLTGILILFLYHYKKLTANLSFLKQSMIYTIGIILLVNILNFDYLIYHVDKPSTSAGIDYAYLAGLSTDAHYFEDELKELKPAIEQNNAIDRSKMDPAYTILSNIDGLRYKYDPIKEINNFNISEYREYLATKHINVEAYRKMLSQREQKQNSK